MIRYLGLQSSYCIYIGEVRYFSFRQPNEKVSNRDLWYGGLDTKRENDLIRYFVRFLPKYGWLKVSCSWGLQLARRCSIIRAMEMTDTRVTSDVTESERNSRTISQSIFHPSGLQSDVCQ